MNSIEDLNKEELSREETIALVQKQLTKMVKEVSGTSLARNKQHRRELYSKQEKPKYVINEKESGVRSRDYLLLDESLCGKNGNRFIDLGYNRNKKWKAIKNHFFFSVRANRLYKMKSSTYLFLARCGNRFGRYFSDRHKNLKSSTGPMDITESIINILASRRKRKEDKEANKKAGIKKEKFKWIKSLLKLVGTK